MKPYELLLIITPDHDENAAEALTDQVKGIIESGGAIVKVDPWGKKRLAYPIQKRNEGYYVLYIFESAPSFVAELNQSLHVIEAILRYMIVQYEDDINKLKAELASEAEQPTPKAEQPTSETEQSTSQTEESTSDGDAAEVETEDATDDGNAETVDDDATDNDAEAEDTTESA